MSDLAKFVIQAFDKDGLLLDDWVCDLPGPRPNGKIVRNVHQRFSPKNALKAVQYKVYAS